MSFNAKTQDVTLFDPVTQQVLATKPLGAVVRWLSNEQRFWDGRYIWTYDFPEDRVQAIAIDPRDGQRRAHAADRRRRSRPQPDAHARPHDGLGQRGRRRLPCRPRPRLGRGRRTRSRPGKFP